ncbi:PIN domain-containing protein [Variovorax ginsengisoli]|uniref:Ribonuclease VapC n=1 Tax=Variovorax ginsengisoli TaxID=363844 RepID=A0ABT8S8R0_9BURK|nr:PIN domain-containing protein [Variovorax ginsengisoli]MDN8615703.1 PIN domain-containing protein [Variovorax ginsengisoli]MDO1534873.1 PIN domain-containing protein [Variovorax ginsengisoli]
MNIFFDTNVLVYAVDAGDPVRKEIAIDRFARAVKDDTVMLSTQVLQEFYNITTRKLKPPLSAREAVGQLSQLCAFEVIGSSADSVLAASELAQKHRLQWWDALILEAAIRGNADVLVSQDGQHGQRFGKLVVENPFSPT